MDTYGERVLRAAVNVLYTRGQDGREWLDRAVLVATGDLDHTHLDAGVSSGEQTSPRSAAAEAAGVGER